MRTKEMRVTPIKKKFKFRFDDGYSIFDRGKRSRRYSLPSFDIQGVKLQNSTKGKQRISLPSVALTTLKQHFSKGRGSLLTRRASLASLELLNFKLSNGEVRKKQKTGSEDLQSMPDDNLLETHSMSSSIATLASNDSELFTRTTTNVVSKFRRTSEPADVGANRKDNTSDTDSIKA
ncbi:hypothetical protein CHS0354_020817 [Potamilus streckersoni]|uniref:Uncharacterized protein n=1 Tax=Potamilus streckersoni TaxID=2493646 RepID=A0AAE0RQV9_9BIVA|nr:hypothetical protein CHS0354_020817 [Potamilus streckersoni]